MAKKIDTKYGQLIEVGRMYQLIPPIYELNKQKCITFAKAKKSKK